MNSIESFLRDEGGPAAVEYAVLLSLITVGCIAAIGALGARLAAAFTSIAERLEEAGV